MIEMNLQLFGGRGSAGGNNPNGRKIKPERVEENRSVGGTSSRKRAAMISSAAARTQAAGGPRSGRPVSGAPTRKPGRRR